LSTNLVTSSFSYALQLATTVFHPKLILRQVFALTLLQIIYEWSKLIANTVRRWNTMDAAQRIAAEREETKSYVQWKEATSRLNTIAAAVPADTIASADSKLLQMKSDLYRSLLRKRDVGGLMFHLRKDLLRAHQENRAAKNVHNVYRETVVAALRAVAEYHHTEDDDTSTSFTQRQHVSLAERLAFFNETRHSFGRSALCLSGGATLGLYHIGVVKALVEQQLLPRVISGASAGSIIAAILGTRMDSELSEIFIFENINARFFTEKDTSEKETSEKETSEKETSEKETSEKEEKKKKKKKKSKKSKQSKSKSKRSTNSNYSSSSTLDQYISMLPPPLPMLLLGARRKIRKGYALDINTLERSLRENCGQYTFQEAFDRTGRIVNIVVTPTRSGRIPMVLNYLTSPHVLMWSAALASCAVPGVFEPVELRCKDRDGEEMPYFPQGQRWSDGSVENDLPMQRLSELFNVNHFIVSQVNPHALFFAGTSLGSSSLARLIQFLKTQVKAWIKNVSMLSFQFNLPLLGKGLLPLLTQRYEGDVTLVPRWGMNDLFELFKDPDKERFETCKLEGERITWPKLERLRDECQVEFIMDQCCRSLRRKMAMSEGLVVVDGDSSISGERGKESSSSRSTRIPSFTTSASLLGINMLDAGAPGPGNVVRSPSFARRREV
jgi:TAG lipase/steryl ester hydrolase/phospholipase A2/LPA acyltransferase